MKTKADPTPRFAVDRAAILAQLPGVRLTETAKRFARGRPKLDANRLFPTAQGLPTGHRPPSRF
ncbi:hypothetical protein [Congregicoccus parvus]|uniref:hypothetical protein n=1 Tax=Congregicoccus parvus TaxID=3081749 RepID=UPI003FA53182